MPIDPRLVTQVQQVLDELPGAAAYPPDWQDVGLEYFYREHSVLVRRDVLEPVTAALRSYLRAVESEQPPPTEQSAGQSAGQNAGQAAEQAALDREFRVDPVHGVSDVSRLDYADPDRLVRLERARSPYAVEWLERRFGADKVRLEAVLTLAAHPCPATEPEEVPAATRRPFPDVDDRPRHGCGGGQGCGCGGGVCSGRGGGHGCGCGHGGHGGGHGGAHGRGDGVLVAVADLGLYPDATATHDWLAGVEGDPEDTYTVDANGNRVIRPYAGHGTFVAGCVRATAPEASVHVVRALELKATSSGSVFEADFALHLADVLALNPDVVVIEFSTNTRKDQSMLALDDLYENRIKGIKGPVFVVPAGNQGVRAPQFPAALDWTLSVGALSANWRTRADFSNFGGWVDVYAPGENLVNAFPVGDYACCWAPHTGSGRHFEGMARWSGTSFAAPLVAGLIAARMSCTGENARQAADALLAFARSQAVPGVGAVLFPGQACCSAPSCCCR